VFHVLAIPMVVLRDDVVHCAPFTEPGPSGGWLPSPNPKVIRLHRQSLFHPSERHAALTRYNCVFLYDIANAGSTDYSLNPWVVTLSDEEQKMVTGFEPNHVPCLCFFVLKLELFLSTPAGKSHFDECFCNIELLGKAA
jgi:hypothetical protein